MISVPRLYASQCPKSINHEPTPRGIQGLSLEEKLNILGQVQGAHTVGDAVLNARWADSKAHKRQLINSMTQRMIQIDNIPEYIAPVLSMMVIDEIAGTNRCKRCNGTGEVFSRKQNKYNPCKACHGAGQIAPTHDTLLKHLNNGLRINRCDITVSATEWSRKYYDSYMDYVDELHKSASDAMQFARELLRRTQSLDNIT